MDSIELGRLADVNLAATWSLLGRTSGADVGGSSADANTMRLGLPFNAATSQGQNKTFIAGIHGTVLTTPAVQVFVDANGQLGTLTPPIVTGSGTASPQSNPGAIIELQRQVQEQRQIIADLTARLVALEADRSTRARRR